MIQDDDTPLGRWSRRKHETQQAKAVLPPPAEAAPAPADAAEVVLPNESEAEILARLGLPDPDMLGMGDDFSVFMAKAVPEIIRRRALRRLWVSNPVLANLDGLNDYDGDFTESGLAGGVLKTAYRAGKGYLRDLAETGPERESAPAAAPCDAAQQALAAPPAGVEPREVSGIAELATPEQDEPGPSDAAEAPAPRPGRMRFNFSGQD